MERKFEVGQKVRCNQTGSYCKDGELGTIVAYYNDGYVIKWDREYIEAMGSGHCKDYPPCASWLNGSELEPTTTFKVGDRVRHQEYGEGTVISTEGACWHPVLVEFDKQDLRLHNSSGRGRTDSCWWCAEPELTPIPSTISTEQMIKALMDNPKLKAECVSGQWHGAFVNDCGTIRFGDDSGDFRVSKHTYHAKWTLIYPPSPKPVEFLEAVRAYLIGHKDIRCKHLNTTWDYVYNCKCDASNDEPIGCAKLEFDACLNGTWFIKED